MASPQKENGYTAIANEIIERMATISFSVYEIRVIFIVWRKTYGWKKKEDWIALSQISKMTNILPQHVSRTIKGLIKRNILKRNGRKIGFNKNYEQWDSLLPIQVIPNEVRGVTYPGIKNIPIQVTTKEKKETIQKKDVFPYKNKKEFIPVNWKDPYNLKKHTTGQFRLKVQTIKALDGNLYCLPNGVKGEYILRENYIKYIHDTKRN